MSEAFNAIERIMRDDLLARFSDRCGNLAVFPERLALLGALPSKDSPKIAMVGTRRSDPDAEDFVERLAAELAMAGATLVSGGARVIDASAHRGALAESGKTVANVASWAVPPNPAPHQILIMAMIDVG